MKQRALSGLVATGVGLLLLGFACVDADIPNISNDLREALEENYGNGGAPVGSAGSASTPTAGAAGDDGNGGAAGAGGAPAPGGGAGGDGGAAGSGMVGMAGAGMGAAGSGGGDCDGFGIIATNCAGGSCHSTPGSPFGDFAVSEDAARELVGEDGTSCAGQGPLIDPEDPAGSVLVQKLKDEASCGQPMPLGTDPLSDEDIACIEEWMGEL